MKKKLIIISIVLSALMIGSCVKDLDVTPIDPNIILAGNLGDDPDYMKQVLAKIYASFLIAGQGSSGGADITASNEDFFTTTRALWNCQEISTDEAMCAWTDVGIYDINTQTWSASNPFLTALYQRLGLSITYANDFIRYTTGNTDPDIIQYRAEARFLRALAYYYYMDLFGNPPFTTEEDGVGKFYPKQIERAKLFNYVVAELKDMEGDLGDPGFSYPQADKAACWMLLARTYLNAEVFTGTAKWDSCKIYCDKVLERPEYYLAPNYRQNFCADNDPSANPEMIFALAQDGTYIQGYVGSTFIIESCSDSRYIRAEEFHGLTSNTNWNGNRMRKDFLDILVDTIATYGNVPIPKSDSLFALCADTRAFLKMKLSMDIPSASSNGDYGIGVYKFTAKNYDGSMPANANPAFACTDFPIFRLADAYLMRAEALINLGYPDLAKDDVNMIRERAFGNDQHNVTAADLIADPDYILWERGREFYFEAHRRTDLVRFNKYTGSNYLWSWKGGTYEGTSTDAHLNIFPIPADEVAANDNITQNDDY